ncbi:hypothetical protein TI39_contig4111g00020 [Zymoseptoria brevis]|uniref:ARID domain-containing protein n=1 Tax=Zymoseptoria brevis TaxID=1047168 RepID=A0A0F4GET6_9PEZI|nr:hypothetical protein TI39_contig4111g00020 [Zymoseptoria brevis]
MARGDHDTAGISLGNIINGTARSRRSTSNRGGRVLRKTPARIQRLNQANVQVPAKESLQKARKVGTGRVAKTTAGTKGKTGGKKKAGASSSSTTGIKRDAPPSKPASNKRGRVTGRSFGQPQDRDALNEDADEVDNEEQNGDVTMGGTAAAPRKIAKAKVFRSGKWNRVTRSQGPVNPVVAVATAPAATAPSAQPPPAPAPAVIAAPIQTAVAGPAQTQQDEEDSRDEEHDHDVQVGADAEHQIQGGGPEQTAAAGTIVGDAEVADPSGENPQEEETTDSGNQVIGAGPENDLAKEKNGQATTTGQQTPAQVVNAGGQVDAAPTHASQIGNADTETSAEQIAGTTNASKAQATTQTSETEQTSAEKEHVGGATSTSAAPTTSGVEPAAAFHSSVPGLAEAQKDTDTAAKNAGGDAAGGDAAGGDAAGGEQLEEMKQQDTGSGVEKGNADKAEVPGEESKDLITVGKEQEMPEDNDTAIQGSHGVDQTLSLPELSHSDVQGATQTPVAGIEADAPPSFPDVTDSNVEEVAQTTQGNADVEEDPPVPDVSERGIENASQAPFAGTSGNNPAAPSQTPTSPANKQSSDQNGSTEHPVIASTSTTSALPAAGLNGTVKKIDPRQKFFSDLTTLHGKTKEQIDATSSVMGIADGNALDIDMFELRLMIETTSFNHSQDIGHWIQLASIICNDRMIAEGAGEKLRDFYRQWIHPLTFADQEAAYNAGYRDAFDGRNPIRRRLRKEGLRLSPHRIYLFAQIIADFGGYDMLSISRQAGDHGCTEQVMRQLHLQDEDPNDPINDETAAEILMDIYHDFLREAEPFFPEFGPVHNELEWSRLDSERRARQVNAELEALQQQDDTEHYKLLEAIAKSHRTSIASMYDYLVGDDKIDLYALFKAYEKYIDSYGSFPHTTSDAVWQTIGREMGLNYSRRTALHRIYASYERFLRPLFRSHAHFGQLDAIDDTYKPEGSFHHQFNQAMRSLTPQGPLALGQDTVSAFRLYSAVQDRGDYNAISASPAEWDNIATVLGCGGQLTDAGKTAGAVLQQGYEALFLEEDDDVHEFGDDEDDDGGDDDQYDDYEDGDTGYGGAGSSYNGLSGGHSFSSHFGFLAGGGLARPAMTAAPGTSPTAAYTQDGDDLPDASDDGGTEVSHLSDFYRLGGSQLGATASHRRAARPAAIEEYDSDEFASEGDNNKQGDARKSPSPAQGSESSGSSSKRKRNASSDAGGNQGDNDIGAPFDGVKRMKTVSPKGPSSPFAPLLEGTPAPSRVQNIASEGKSRAKPANKGPFLEDRSSDSEIDPGNAPRAHSPKSQQLFEGEDGSHFRPGSSVGEGGIGGNLGQQDRSDRC